jgi:hypothetical protein
MMPRRLALLALVPLAPTCRHPTGASERDWIRWFDSTAQGLGRWNVGDLRLPEGEIVQTRDRLSFRLGHDWRKRNDYGCWDTREDAWPRGAWRDICVSRLVPESYVHPRFFLRPVPLDPEMADQHQSEDWEVGVVVIAGRRAIVERARVSGGIEGAKRERRTSILIELRPGDWVHLQGRMGDDLGFADILGIAATIRSS